MIRNRTNDRSKYRNTRSILWQKCTNLRALKQIHASILVHGFNSDVPSLRELIFAAAVSISSTIDYAHQLFDHISQPDTFMWNSLIRGSAMSGNPSNALLLYGRMEKLHVSPDRFTFPCLFKACTKLSWVHIGYGIHGKVSKLGFESNSYVRNALINFHSNCGDLGIAKALFDESAKRDLVAWSSMASGYARRGNLEAARKIFDEMPERDLVSWNVMITGYAKQGDMDSARKLFDEVPKRDVVTWNVIVAGYVGVRENSLALEAFEAMRIAGVRPDEVTMISVLSACSELGDLEAGANVHRCIVEMGSSGGLTILLANALVNMYAKCGSIRNAQRVFNGTARRDVTTWNSMIGGLAFHGHAKEALDLFEEMLGSKIKPDEITFVGVLVSCSHAGRVEEGRVYFNMMRTKYNIKPNVRHYGCMVDILGRAGLLSEAFEFIERMEVEPNAVVWRSLLGACRVHGDVELGRQASERLRGMRTSESGDYVLLSNIYASRGEWDGAEKVRKSMDDCGVLKEAGYSLIETDDNDQIRQFC